MIAHSATAPESAPSAAGAMSGTAQVFIPVDDLFPPRPSPPGRTARLVPALLFTPRRSVPSKSKINAVFDETHSPEEVMATHIAGFAAAHARRVGSIRLACDKQGNDDERVRRIRAPTVRRGTEPLHHPHDGHVLEQVLNARAERRAAERPLPPERTAFERHRQRYFFY
jgi:hypothetical protein